MASIQTKEDKNLAGLFFIFEKTLTIYGTVVNDLARKKNSIDKKTFHWAIAICVIWKFDPSQLYSDPYLASYLKASYFL